MTNTTVRVGDVVAWDDVPSGAMIKDGDGDFAVHIGQFGHYVHQPSNPHPLQASAWYMFAKNHWTWLEFSTIDDIATVVALNLTGNETADELRAMAERFEVRQILKPWMCEDSMSWGNWYVTLGWPGDIDMAEGWGRSSDAACEMAARRLHDAGWKPTMGPEDAQRLMEANEAREATAHAAQISAMLADPE